MNVDHERDTDAVLAVAPIVEFAAAIWGDHSSTAAPLPAANENKVPSSSCGEPSRFVIAVEEVQHEQGSRVLRLRESMCTRSMIGIDVETWHANSHACMLAVQWANEQ